mmetsp:Transcript_61093/g.117717  ORF Transcript_61093/g.117717 Transcript_61093/m.117717 type:complete len:99 (+) Transcript_61093:763-1059(+)
MDSAQDVVPPAQTFGQVNCAVVHGKYKPAPTNVQKHATESQVYSKHSAPKMLARCQSSLQCMPQSMQHKLQVVASPTTRYLRRVDASFGIDACTPCGP